LFNPPAFPDSALRGLDRGDRSPYSDEALLDQRVGIRSCRRQCENLPVGPWGSQCAAIRSDVGWISVIHNEVCHLQMSWKHRVAGVANRFLTRLGGELVDIDEVWRPTSFLRRQPQPPAEPPASAGAPILRVWKDDGDLRQTPFDFSVVIPSTLRNSLVAALQSVFDQDLPGRIQILVGIDFPIGDVEILEHACLKRPRNREVFAFWPGYSTSVRHGGLHPSWDGGVMRTVLSYLANSRHVAYLDDDNWWAPQHLSSLQAALAGCQWAWAKRWFVHPESRRPVCIDEWESVGPDLGIYAPVGGFVDPSCLAIDKIACEAVLRWWSIPLRDSGLAMDADRNVFRILRQYFRGRGTGRATAYYVLDRDEASHPQRLANIGKEAYERAAGEHVATDEPEAKRTSAP